MHERATILAAVLSLALIGACGKKDSPKAEDGESKNANATKTTTNTPPPDEKPAPATVRSKLAGQWRSVVTLEGDEDLEPQRIPFGLTISPSDAEPSVVTSGNHTVPITKLEFQGNEVTMDFESYQTRISATVDAEKGTMTGTWSLPWVDGSQDFGFEAKRVEAGTPISVVPDDTPPVANAAIEAVPSVAGVWEVSFPQYDGSTKLCGATFEQTGTSVQGALVAPTGDYGFLDGTYVDGKLRLFHFDGAFAYVVAADAQADGSIVGAGQFNLFQQKFSARPVKDGKLDAELPKCAEVNEWSGKDSPLSLTFTDLNGKDFPLADAGLDGKVVLFDFFGTWCPNCHQLIPLLKDWHDKYQSKGLEIIGVGFEFADGPKAVSAYRVEHEIPYTMLVGAPPHEAANIMPQVSLTSYPTLMLVGRDGKIHSIQVGFRGPATGDFRAADAARFEARIQKLLGPANK